MPCVGHDLGSKRVTACEEQARGGRHCHAAGEVEYVETKEEQPKKKDRDAQMILKEDEERTPRGKGAALGRGQKCDDEDGEE